MVSMSTFDPAQPRDASGLFATKRNSAPSPALVAEVHDAAEFIVPQGEARRGSRFEWADVSHGTHWDGVSTRDREVFVTAHSAALADALHARTGWPIVAFGDGPDGPVGWVHAGVLTPGGLLVDAAGLHEPADWVDQWGQFTDSCGADEPDYDWDAVWTYNATAFGWGGAGVRFNSDPRDAQLEARAGAVASAILGQWNGRW